jgi:4-alpha-glucanotransferase
MTIFFQLRFSTQYGQQMLVLGDHPALGDSDPAAAVAMQYLNGDWWGISIDIPKGRAKGLLRYKYLLREPDGRLVEEWGMDRLLNLDRFNLLVRTADTWSHAGEFEQCFLSGPFRNILLPERAPSVEADTTNSPAVHFRVKAPLLAAGQSLRIIGTGKQLGNWEESQSLPMHWQGRWWEAQVDAEVITFSFRYKYGVWNDLENKWVRYEEGDDRILSAPEINKEGDAVIHDGFVRLPNNTWRAAGLSVPVFSIRTRQSFGVGEFLDLPLLADWAQSLGLRLIQILPVNDTTAFHNWKDSYPYAGISAFALHPLYVSLKKIAGSEHADLLEEWASVQAELNGLSVVDYEGVMKAKWSILRSLYERTGKSCLASRAYKSYWKEQAHWLKPYCVFSYLRDKYQTADFSEWPELNTYSEDSIKPLLKAGTASAKAIAFYGFVQFHLHLQLKEAVEYLHKKGIILKGDIPIGINRHGCDAWVAPELYHMNWQAGAPPDDFTAIGQNWGFPTYNWKRMQADGFRWWKQRFQQMELYYDAFRIDHILGFFRIWSIPTHAVEGLLGRFVPAIPLRPTAFSQKGIPFDVDRLCKPYITDTHLHHLFGADTDAIRTHFLEPAQMGLYHLKPAFATQKQIERYFQQHEQWAVGTREKLYSLVANVILLPDEEVGQGYHFRISMDKTYSYACLPDSIQRNLHELYIDYFYKHQDDFWFREAMQKLPSLKASTNMLVCGEDLGMVPHCVPEVMQQLGILSLEIQRMPKDPKRRFFHPQDAPYLSVVTPSTHDMSTIRAWWEEDGARTREFYHHELKQWGDPPQFCESWVSRSVLEQHLQSPAMWSIFQVQDILGCAEKLRRTLPQEERINDPANPNQYWQYRMHMSLEQLLTETSFSQEFEQLVRAYGRS